MKFSFDKLPRHRVRHQATLTEVEVAEFFEQALTRLAETVKVTGFRPGKAPAKLVREQLSPDSLREEAYSLAVRSAWSEIIRELAAEKSSLPIQDPEVSVEAFEEGQAAQLVFEYDTRPTVQLGAWEKIKITTKADAAVSDQELADILDSLSRGHAKTIVTLEPIGPGKQAEISFEGSVNHIRLDKLTAKKFAITVGHSSVIPGFEDHLMGMKKGAAKNFAIDFPKDHFDKELAGQKIDFAVTVDEVFDLILPPLDDNFAEKFGHQTLPELKKSISEDITKRKAEEQRVTQKAEWLAAFEKVVKVEVPVSLIDTEIARSRQSWQEFLQSRHLEPAAWLKQRGTTMEQLEADWRVAAESSVKIGLGLAEIANQQKRELVDNAEFQKLLDELVDQAIAKK